MAKKIYNKLELESFSIMDLRKIAKEEFFIRPKNTKKAELIEEILERQKQFVDDKPTTVEKVETEKPPRPERKPASSADVP